MATNTSRERKWHEMTSSEKLVWCGKLVIALLTFGFAFPRVMDPHLQD
jgi:hypothetical protein